MVTYLELDLLEYEIKWAVGSITTKKASGGDVKNLPANAGDTGDLGSIPGPRTSPVGENGNPQLHGERSLVGYTLKESDTTWQACSSPQKENS